MSSCKEFYLDDILAITAIPVTDFPVGDASWQVTKTIPMESFSPTLTNAITIGMVPAVSGGMLIPIRRKTGKVKDDESDSVAGRAHAVDVSCEVDDREASVWEYLTTLERTPCHLLLTFRDAVTRAFVCATEDTYTCNVDRDNSSTSVSFRIRCLMGLQLLTQA